jgi:putative tricarboxylic transport membrane protein
LNRRADGFIALGIMAFGLVLLAGAMTFPAPTPVRDPIGPMGLPIVIAAVFIVGGGLQAYHALWSQRALGPMVTPDGPEDEEGYPVSNRRAAAFLAGGLIYVVLLPTLGFLIATPLIIGIGLWLLEYRTPWKVLLIGVGFTVISFAVFSSVLSIPVPVGILTGLLVALDIIPPTR